jgi:hypothetical protein
VQSADHADGQVPAPVQDFRDPRARANRRFQALAGQPLLLRAEFDGLHWIGCKSVMMFHLQQKTPPCRTVHFRGPANREYPVNVCRGATMFNANVVNGDSGVRKLRVFWQKNAFSGRFVALKNTVNYSSRFELTIRRGVRRVSFVCKNNALRDGVFVYLF